VEFDRPRVLGKGHREGMLRHQKFGELVMDLPITSDRHDQEGLAKGVTSSSFSDAGPQS
jgi:hypothetical protein